MRRFATSIAVALVIALTFAARASATDIGKLLENKEGPDQFQIIHVADLAKLMADPVSKVQIFDANHSSTRENFGVIPGAHLLTSSDNYEVAKELPADKNARLVFYCADTH
jgi:rhodanese-related sulfurtransferase